MESGPDLRGLLRGYTGGQGMSRPSSRRCRKLLPFQPERLIPTGISPNTALALLKNGVKWVNYQMPSKEPRQAMFEIGKAESGRRRHKDSPLLACHRQGRNAKKILGDIWEKRNADTTQDFHIVRGFVHRFTSEEQMK